MGVHRLLNPAIFAAHQLQLPFGRANHENIIHSTARGPRYLTPFLWT